MTAIPRADTTLIEALTERLLTDGFEARAPDRWTAADDADICAGASCSECGFAPLMYRPFWRQSDRLYRALSVCGLCGRVGDFS